MDDVPGLRRALVAQRTATEHRRADLFRELQQVVAATRDVATDDEHDPEGQTIAYERARTMALVRQAETQLVEVDAALARVAAGDYGSCESCGGRIATERLRARPTVRTCIVCAERRW